ncbi:MAG: zf-HC2 domain-containing protein, partial [Actinomycetota bacterium]|nr:zf-HC2 domain-containing protein [Acidimicrobiia bacterium]MBA3575605.1 zf-HC2 domain-containing protein [Pseudonocardiales bacterium]MDQ3293044.1 zf-HC2 domain-containing protein [Actinomycetota bacterium]
MSTWAHRRTKRLLTAYVDGELDQTAAVAAHLRECWGCSGDVAVTRMVKRSLRNLGDRDRDHDTLGALRLRRFAAQLGT